jgi:para-nitrobenzyl esterase
LKAAIMLVHILRLLAAGAVAVAAAAPSVTLPNGATVTGLMATNVAGNPVQVFRGIPYAEPPVGDKRWKPSTLKPITSDLSATKYGSSCHGVSFGPGPSPTSQSEDCLFLNVFAPADATKDSKLPVMLWIHGGAFVAGAGDADDAPNIIAAADEALVVVSINYRLGVFGFFSNQQLLAEGGGANFGLQDQEVAFAWVKQYISAFGGNPNDITAFGESAGSMSIAMHMLSRDGNQKLFHKSIQQSGAYTVSHDTATPAVQQNQTLTIARGVGCGDAADVMACLRKATASDVYKVGGSLNWIPTVDGVYMKELPIKRLLAGKVSRVPSIVGTNADEGWLFTMAAAEASQYDSFVRGRFSMLTEAEFAQLAKLYAPESFDTPHHRTAEIFGDVIFVCPSEQFSEALTGTANYRYRFNFASSEFGTPLVVHAKAVAFVFNQVKALPNDTDTATVVDYFQSYWTKFASTGSPNGAGNGATQQQAVSFQWPLFETVAKKQLVIQPKLTTEVSGTSRAGHAERCAFWLAVEQRLANEVAFLA